MLSVFNFLFIDFSYHYSQGQDVECCMRTPQPARDWVAGC